MRARAVPIAALILAAAWCLAQLLDSPVLAVVTVVAALGSTMGLGCRSRPGRLLPWLLAGIMAVLGVWLAALLVIAPGPRSLALQLLMLVALAPLLPLLYALSFPDRERAQRRDEGP